MRKIEKDSLNAKLKFVSQADIDDAMMRYFLRRSTRQEIIKEFGILNTTFLKWLRDFKDEHPDANMVFHVTAPKRKKKKKNGGR